MAEQATQLEPYGKIAETKLVKKMSDSQDLEPNQYAGTVIKSCFSGDPTPEQFMAFLMIAKEHHLNPITREIYAFSKGGKVVPIVSIDGWLKLVNSHPQFDGMQFVDQLDDAENLIAVTCKIFRKDRKHPTEVSEYLDECRMPTEPWKKWPARMLRHKATIQCARYAFGFSGIYDADEGVRISETDLEGHATIIDEEEPETPAKRIVHKIKTQAEEKDLAPETAAEKPSATPAVETLPDDDNIIVDPEDIPGVEKGLKMPDGEEISPENQEWIDDFDGKGKGDRKK